MRIPSHHQQRSRAENESMTPMIDVVFLLLVFFVCASIGQKPESLLPAELTSGQTDAQIELPPQEPQEPPPPEVRIRLQRSDTSGQLTIALNEGTVSGAAELTQRLQRLAELDPRSRVILDIEDSVSVQQFIGIYDLCQVLAFESISFAVRQPVSP